MYIHVCSTHKRARARVQVYQLYIMMYLYLLSCVCMDFIMLSINNKVKCVDIYLHDNRLSVSCLDLCTV